MKKMVHLRNSKRVCFSLPTSVPVCSEDPAFTLTTPNWKSVTRAVEISPGSNLYGPGPGPAPNSWLTLYTVPPNRLAMLLTASYSRQNFALGGNAAIRDVRGRFYLTMGYGKGLKRFPLLDENDQFVVWNRVGEDGDEEVGGVGASFIEFDKTLPCGSFYKILRFSTFEDKASDEYTIPAGHSAILCPNKLLGGTDGSSLASTVIFGAFTTGVGPFYSEPFGIDNIVDSITFFESIPFGVFSGDRLETSVLQPTFTAFKAGVTFRIKYPAEGENPDSNGGLKTGQAALLVKPHLK